MSVLLDRRSLAALYDDHGELLFFNVCLRTLGAHGSAAGVPGDAPASSVAPVEDANRRLARAQREVLALRDLAGCSYDAIATLIRADREAVAELLWRARLELRDRLEDSGLVSIAAVAEPCRRALPLIAARLDGELRDAGARRRLQAHLRSCGKCRVSQEAMREADVAYRAWPPEPPPPGLAETALFSDPAAEPAA